MGHDSFSRGMDLIRSLDRSGLKRFAVARVVICVQLGAGQARPSLAFSSTKPGDQCRPDWASVVC